MARMGTSESVCRTWRVTPELAERVSTMAEAQGIYPSDLVRFLLIVALDLVDTGELEIPTRPAGPPNRVDWDRVHGLSSRK